MRVVWIKLYFLILIYISILGCSHKDEFKKITFKDFRRIKIGMNIAEVKKIMGESLDIKEGDFDHNGVQEAVYRWQGHDGKNFAVVIEDNQVRQTAWSEPMGKER